MAANFCVARHREYPIFTFVCPFCLSSASISSTIAKLEIVVVEGGRFHRIPKQKQLGFVVILICGDDLKQQQRSEVTSEDTKGKTIAPKW
jgi:hypothetical protein